ncbi:general substrate transporter [Lobosporangium transversale]|uniref:General substrate transporter n=1 Tax=Lobosporangium transversale TaxID=64571 RepID=A0A1Y2GYP3_9FUNG|nr:general substrate transporter [Lobosporangium transversale]ORZ27397.1 general substrate transporter [Lobosporangium transversale]|eukprot:XP_021885124.1 general substrate transporter [Lobosporangium transversale]
MSAKYRLLNNVYFLGGFATIGGMLFGFDISSMSGVVGTQRYQEYFNHPSSSLQGGIVASMAAGSFLGALLAGPLGDKISRKRTIMLAASIWIVGSIIQCATVNVGMLIVGRIINGIAVGLASMIVPVYQSEIAPKNIRGRIVSLQQWAITWGILIQYFIQYGCSFINSEAAFRIPWGVQIIPGIILLAGISFFPYSPRWLADHGRGEEALEVLAMLRAKGNKNDPLVMAEYKEIEDAIKFDRTQAARSYAELFRKPNARRVFLGMSLQSWSQLTGMNVAMYYIVFIFQGAGITGQNANLQASSIQYILNVIMTIPAILFIDKWGRRPVLLVGSTFMALWMFLIGGLMGRFGGPSNFEGNETTTWAIQDNDAASKAVIACSYLFVCSFAISWGPVSWTYPAEIYPLRIRSKAVSLSTASNWAFNFILAYAVPPLLENIQYKTYFIFGAFCVAMTIHVFFMFPETKGHTLEEMDELFNSDVPAWKTRAQPQSRLDRK